MADYMTFKTIYEAVESAISQTTGSATELAKIMVNMVYLNEILNADDLHPLFWLVDFDDSLKSKAPAETVTGITKATPPVVSDATHTFAVGDLVLCHEVEGMTELNGRVFQAIAVSAGVSFSLGDIDGSNIAGTGYTAWTSGGKFKHCGLKLATTNKDVKRIISAGWQDLSGNMDPAEPGDIEESTAYLGESPSRPTKCRHIKRYAANGDETNFLQWFNSADDAYDLRYWFEKRVARLSADADVPILPPEFHDMIVAGAITRLAENNVQVDNQVVWPGIYKAQLSQFRSFNRKYYKDHPKGKPYML